MHTYYKPNKEDGAIIPPIHLTTTFESGNNGKYDYSRTVNPTRVILEQILAKLDGNSFGLAYSSGSAALANIVALLKQNEVILFSSDAYGGTYRFIVRVAGNQGIKYRIVDLTDYSNEPYIVLHCFLDYRFELFYNF